MGNFDFFNYAGIHRSVFLYKTEPSFISDVTIVTVNASTTGTIHSLRETNEYIYSVSSSESFTESRVRYTVVSNGSFNCVVSIKNKRGVEVAKGLECSGEVRIRDAKLWWPHTHSKQPGNTFRRKTNYICLSIPSVYVS